MASPQSQPHGTDAQSKVAIPRLNKRRPSNNGPVEKPRAVRACLGCRQLKMRCSGEARCQRCTTSGRPCVYPKARKERIKSVAEQNEHMLKLMRHLKERVTDEDKEQIEDLLERVRWLVEIHHLQTSLTVPQIGATSRGRRKGGDPISEATPEATQSEDVREATSDVSMKSPTWTESSAPEFTGKVSNLQWLENLANETSKPEVTFVDTTTQQDSASLLINSSNAFDSPSPKKEIGSSALFETFWYLQRELPGEEAQKFLDHVKSSGSLDASSIEAWLQNRYTGWTDSPFSPAHSVSDTSIGLPVIGTSPSSTRRESKSIDGMISGQAGSPADELSTAQSMGQHVTITAVRQAVDMFFCSTGLLFYIIPKDQQESLFHATLSRDDGPIPETATFVDVLRNSVGLHARARLAEISGMAAIGLLYLRISNEERAPPPKLGHYFYSITKQMLDSAVEVCPLRAMKVCALLALYNIYVKARVAMAYVELGLGLAQLHGLSEESQAAPSPEEVLDFKRTLRTLITFNGWLAASLGYASGQLNPSLAQLDMELDAKEEDVVQQELVKVTIIKARIIRSIPDDGVVEDNIIDGYRRELNDLNERLPEWMAMKTLITTQSSTPLRKITFYFHLFFLSAMQLLHRRAMANPTYCCSPGRLSTRTGVREGLMAAKMAARMLALMQQESFLGQFCWMCIYSSYTSGIIILQAAVQKILTGYHSSTWIADLTLANMCVQVLGYCAEVDSVATRMMEIVQRYMEVIKDAVNAKLNVDPGENNNEDELVDYLFSIPPGDTNLHKAARDLLRLIQYPFGTSLELIPEGGPRAPPLRTTLVNWMEAAVGIPQEWDWELQNCGLKADNQYRGEEFKMRDVMSKLTPGRFVPMGDSSPWTAWTGHPF